MSRSLGVPLTPLQKGLQRLEKGEIILSFLEGKTRVYQWNLGYPLFTELEQLLKKSYTLLSPLEKKSYYSLQEEGPVSAPLKTLQIFWEKLASIQHLIFQAKTKSVEPSGWQGRGKGAVMVTRKGDNILLFHEKGSWQGPKVQEVDFSNVFRWTLDMGAGVISLEHLRRGEDAPVFLFHLAPTSSHSLGSIDSHLCEEDTYFGKIYLDRQSLRLQWRILGPKKNEEIDYYYT